MSFPDFLPPCPKCKQSVDDCNCSSERTYNYPPYDNGDDDDNEDNSWDFNFHDDD